MERVDQALRDSRFIIFFVSESSLSSHWVSREIRASLTRQLEDNESRILPAILDGSSPPTLLKDLLWADLRGPAWDNGIEALARAILQSFNEETADIEEPTLGVGLHRLRAISASPGFHFIIISGISASGKDALLHMIEEGLSSRYHLDVLAKYNTRDPRHSEPEYSNSLSPEEFKQQLDAGEILFPYRKRGSRYGFNTSQLLEAQREGRILAAVFTEFSLVPRVVATMGDAGAPATAFFIEAARKHLERRTLFRNFSHAEIVERTRSIRRDFAELARRPTFRKEYRFIWNGDDRALEQTADELEQAICEIIELQRGRPTSR